VAYEVFAMPFRGIQLEEHAHVHQSLQEREVICLLPGDCDAAWRLRTVSSL
jgi:hypothetical protein